MSSTWLKVGLATVLVCAIGGDALGDVIPVTFGFDVNTADPQQMFLYSDDGVGDPTLTADALVDLTVQFDADPTVTTFSDAHFDFWAEQVDFEEVGIGNILYFDGEFSYTDSEGDLIVGGDFKRAHVLAVDGSSSAAISASSEEEAIGGAMNYTPGQAFLDLAEAMNIFPAGADIQLVPVEDMSFTLTNITPDPETGEATANSSFSGNAGVIPEPATMGLLGIGGLGVLLRKRR